MPVDPTRPARQGVLRRRLRRDGPRRACRAAPARVAELDARRRRGPVHRRPTPRPGASSSRWAATTPGAAARPPPPGPGFTTYHDAGGARVTNIHRMADLVRGAVIAPGASFSINDYVGERTAEKGFVGAGAIRDGLHVDEIGGGVSQFATTMFNAAYFAGPPHRRVAGPLRVLRPLPPRARGDDGLPGARPRLHEQHAVRDHDLDVVHGHQPHRDALLHALRHRASRRPSTRPRRATATSSPPPARSPTRTARPRPTSSVPPTVRAKGSAADDERRAAVRVPHERLRCAHVDHREGPAPPIHDHRGVAARRAGRRRALPRQGRPGQPRDPPPAAAGRRQPVLPGSAPLGDRSQLRPRLPPADRQRRR